MATTLLQLSGLINDSIASLVKVCEDSGYAVPDLHATPATEDTETFRSNPAAKEAANIIIAAALQLAATLSPPSTHVLNIATAHFKSAALRTCIESNVTEALREGGDDGLHVDDLAIKCKLDGTKLARLMRVLANDHVYREVSPEVFANNKLSMILDTGKSVESLQAEPENKHDGTRGFVAYLEHLSSDGHKASAYFHETLTDVTTSHSPEPNHAPFHRAMGIDIPTWKWYELPEQSYRRRRFAVAMQGLGAVQPPDILLKVFDWNQLKPGSFVVDVGGGIGSSILPVCRAHPQLKFVVQDLPKVAELGKNFYTNLVPGSIESGRVTFQGHDFFADQPVKKPSVFVLKHIVHNWSDPYAEKILRQLRAAAGPETTLLLVDFIVSYVCDEPNSELSSIPGASIVSAPKPLLPNYGPVSETMYVLDMVMLAFLNAQERTLGKLASLLESTGWRIKRIHRGTPPGDFMQPVEAVPILN
ncbi:hypothetical protein HGRIS_011021 [Hohenbuehelia grisea]|uniref:S-adenosyl-L-methionine-dependent methyltransferase n=1 Tax=Hohenbuehelia grisea TaxID=104357 RepID=A0ABR3IYZ1_9AGAR